MQVKYKIISIDPNEHSMVVRFYTDILTEEMLSSFKNADGSVSLDENGNVPHCRTDYNINIWQIPAPTGQELQDYIMRNAPVSWFQLQEQILNPNIDTSMSNMVSLIGVEQTKEILPIV